MDAGSQPGLPMTLSGLSNLSANLVSLHWCLGHLTVIVNFAVSQNACLGKISSVSLLNLYSSLVTWGAAMRLTAGWL